MTKASSTEIGAGFDPSGYLLRTVMEDEGCLDLCGEPEEFVRHHTAKLYARPPEADEDGDFEADERHLVASVEFSLIGLSEWEAGGWGSSFECLDGLSQDLCEVGEALFELEDDDEGEHLREELDLVLPSGDLLYIELIEVAPDLRSDQAHEVVRHLLENVLARFGHGCFAAVYFHANWESIALARPLKDRGFAQVPGNRSIWFADLGRNREPLSKTGE